MKLLIVFVSSMLLLSACNLQEAMKTTGDAVTTGVENTGEALKQTPAAVGEAINNVDEKYSSVDEFENR